MSVKLKKKKKMNTYDSIHTFWPKKTSFLPVFQWLPYAKIIHCCLFNPSHRARHIVGTQSLPNEYIGVLVRGTREQSYSLTKKHGQRIFLLHD